MMIGNNAPIYNSYSAKSEVSSTHKKHLPIPTEKEDGCPRDAEGMPGHRHRRADGHLVAKRSDTLVKNLIKKDHISVPQRVPADMTLGNLREITGKVGVHQVSMALRALEKSGALDAMLTK